MILISKYVLPKGYQGITLYPFIVLKHKDLRADDVLIHHERIHLKQQLELFIVLFYIWYGIEFAFRFIQYRNWHLAYRNISFEREAYACENQLSYLKERSRFSFLKYV